MHRTACRRARTHRRTVSATDGTATIDLAHAPGTYVLILENARPARFDVGRLGSIGLRTGFYAYVGSALGPGGLRARVGRHLCPTRAVRWHIDYLKHATRIVEIWYLDDRVRREHAWAKALGRFPGASIPMPGFGSSDCSCPAHFFYLWTAPRLATFARTLGRTRGAGRSRALRLALPGGYRSPRTGNRGAPTGTR
jgi:Uri superfamily endonuclease